MERLIAAERRNRVYERALREMSEAKAQDIADGTLIAAKEARIMELEDIIERMNQRRMRGGGT